MAAVAALAAAALRAPRLLRPAAAAFRTALALALTAWLAAATAAWLLLPRWLNGAVNRWAAASAAAAPYYAAPDDGANGDGGKKQRRRCADGETEDEPAAAEAEPRLTLVQSNPWRRHAAADAPAAAVISSDDDSANGASQLNDDVVQPPAETVSLAGCMQRFGRVPPLRVVIMVAGTRGDVQPATALATRLAEQGHTVRVATHAPYAGLVGGAGEAVAEAAAARGGSGRAVGRVEFFPLAGDPKGMMELTVKHRGMLFSDPRDLSWLRTEYGAIMDSCWEASKDYRPDLIIATAITYGAVHCAEALAVPLHVISTIPWRPNSEICQPWARGFEDTLTGHCTALAAAALPPPPAWAQRTAVGRAYGRFSSAAVASVASAANWWSTALLDHMAWLGIADVVSRFRRRLGLPLLSMRNTGFALYNVPTTFTFSPAMLPRPSDFGPHVAVSGPLLLPAEAAAGAGHVSAAAASPAAAAEAAGVAASGRDGAKASTAAAASVTSGGKKAPPRRSASGVSRDSAGGRDQGQDCSLAASSSGGDGGAAAAAVGAALDDEAEEAWSDADSGAGEVEVEGEAAEVDLSPASSAAAPSSSASGGGGYCPPPELVAFLEREPADPPIYIGFGSMTVAEGRAVAQAIRQAVEATGVRAIVSAGGWGCLAEAGGEGGEGEEEAREREAAECVGKGRVLLVTDVPHDWLFPRCRAVIHHGGVGTTAAGLMAGKPSFVAPSFGDLFLWGEVVARAGVGPAPVPIYNLTAAHLEAAIGELTSDRCAAAAAKVAAALRREDGLAVAVRHIYRGLMARVERG